MGWPIDWGEWAASLTIDDAEDAAAALQDKHDVFDSPSWQTGDPPEPGEYWVTFRSGWDGSVHVEIWSWTGEAWEEWGVDDWDVLAYAKAQRPSPYQPEGE